MSEEPLTYRTSGVDIDEAQRALRAVVGDVRSTYNDNVLAGVGGFGGLFRAGFPDMEKPVLVSSIDGVGTKTKVAAMVGQFGNLGRDIVNHCVNDILCQGARPLFFLDYFGTSRLSGLMFEEVVRGIADACREAGAALIGGETAEMPGVYHDDEIDLVGTIVGVVDQDKMLPRGKLQPGDAVVGIASDGLHTNGFSLARRALFEVGGLSVRDEVPGLGTTIGEELLRPHRSYLKSVYPLLQEVESILGVAHITGGGLFDNLPRAIPSDKRVVIDRRSWTPLPIFKLIQSVGNVPDGEMYRTFNMGVGMALFVTSEAAPAVVQRLTQAGESAAIIGQVLTGTHDVQIA
jgi:phosphoribosylformylglycinamidine cyclo-ligase